MNEGFTGAYIQSMLPILLLGCASVAIVILAIVGSIVSENRLGAARLDCRERCPGSYEVTSYSCTCGAEEEPSRAVTKDPPEWAASEPITGRPKETP